MSEPQIVKVVVRFPEPVVSVIGIPGRDGATGGNAVQSVAGHTGNVTLTDLHLDQVDNTHDAEKSVDFANNSAHANNADLADVATVARTLGGDPTDDYGHMTADNGGGLTIGGFTEVIFEHGQDDLFKGALALEQLDNTSDADKPVSTAQAGAISGAISAAAVLKSNEAWPQPQFIGSCMIAGGEYKLRIITSPDGLKWRALGPAIGFNNNTPLADPSLYFHAPTGLWWVAFTGGDLVDGYHRVSIAYSADLIHWTMLPASQRPNTSSIATTTGGTTWAPEFFLDDDGTVRIYVSVSPDSVNFSIYEFHALDSTLTSWSSPTLVFAPSGKTVIDPFIFKSGSGIYNMLYANKTGTNTYIEWATASSSTGPFTAARTGDWAGWGNGLEAPSLVKLTASHWRIYFDAYTNQGIYYAESYDAGVSWSSKALIDPLEVTGSIYGVPNFCFSHPTILMVTDTTRARYIAKAQGAVADALRFPHPHIRGGMDFITVLPDYGDIYSRRISWNLDGKFIVGKDIAGTGGPGGDNSGGPFDILTVGVGTSLRVDPITGKVKFPLGLIDSAYVCVVDQKGSGVQGGTSTSGGWYTRDLNTVQSDSAGIATLSANQVTLPAGNYEIEIVSPFFNPQEAQLRLQNITDSATSILGMGVYASNNGAVAQLRGKITTTASKVFAVQYRVTNGQGNYGLGTEGNWGNSELYTIAVFRKVP